MAKLERKRGMFFGSWTGGPTEESVEAEIIVGEEITKVEITAATFGGKVSGSGQYLLTYSAAGTTWKLDGKTITASDYGITVTGTPANGDRINIAYTAAGPGWEALGKDNDSLVKELNPDTETSKNVLGESSFKHSGYEPSIDLDPYYMDPSRNMYAHLLECALEEKYGEADLLGHFAEAFFTSVDETTRTMSGYCYVRRAWFVPKSTGGDTSGYSIPYTINPIGAPIKKSISYNMDTNVATISDF